MPIRRQIVRGLIGLEDFQVKGVGGDTTVEQVRDGGIVDIKTLSLPVIVVERANLRAYPSGLLSAAGMSTSQSRPEQSIYYWDPESTSLDDDYSVLVPNDGGVGGKGRWILIHSKYPKSRSLSPPGTPAASAGPLEGGLSMLKSSGVDNSVVALPMANKGDIYRATNFTSFLINVVPQAGSVINNLPTGDPYIMPVGSSTTFFALDSLRWVTFSAVY